MSRLVEWIDRLKLAEGAMLVGTVFVSDQIRGVLETVAALAGVWGAHSLLLLVAAERNVPQEVRQFTDSTVQLALPDGDQW